MTTHLVHRPREWGIALLVVGLTGYGAGATFPASDEPAALDDSYLANAAQLERRVLHRSDELGMPTWMATVGSRLVVIDAIADPALHVIDRGTGDLTRSLGRWGEGPGEFQSVWSLDPVAGSASELWVFDVALRRTTYVDLRDEYFEQELLGEQSINLISPATVTGVMRTNRDELVGPGAFDGGRLGFFDTNGRLVETRGPIPRVDQNLPPIARQHMFQSRAVSHPEHNLFAVASRYATSLEIFGADGSLVALGQAPIEITPDAASVTQQYGFTPGEQTKFGYVDVAASRDFIFALFSGRTLAGFEDRSNYGREVHVFDWDGALRGVIRLEIDAIGLAVDEDSNSLYASEHDPVPTIAEYILAGMNLGLPE